jgi:OmpA-OmpF porin, OOP family
LLRRSLLTTVVLLPTIATAQSISGPYISGAGGVNFANSMLSANGSTKIDSAPGPVGLAALGWGFGNGLRAEIEGSYRSTSVNSISTLRTNFLLEPLANVGGNIGTDAVMANILYDLPTRSLGLPIQPYIGGGLGYSWSQSNGVNGNGFATFLLPEDNRFTAPDDVHFGSASAFAYQAIAGVALPLPFLPGLDTTLEYRFFGTAREDVPVSRMASDGDLINGAIPSSATHNGFQEHDNTLMIGLRYSFGAP